MSLKDGMECPICEVGTLKRITRDETFNYKGKEIVVPNCTIYYCENCRDGLYEKKEEKRIEKILTDERRKIDGLLTSEEIKRIRTSFGYTQVQFARLLGVGEKNFARYEAGQSVQSKSMDLLLRLIERIPEAIDLIKNNFKENSPLCQASCPPESAGSVFV